MRKTEAAEADLEAHRNPAEGTERRHGAVLKAYPPWVVLHVPHDSTAVPEAMRSQLLLDEVELEREMDCMTDHLTLEMFAGPSTGATVVHSSVSRLVVDVERFPDDADEPMAARGMGAVYTATSRLTPLRRPLSSGEREELMNAYYRPHHAMLEAAVATALDLHGKCLVIDCHSFPSEALPYERSDHTRVRPDICVGTDSFHPSAALAAAFTASFRRAGWSVILNKPFAGALVPASRYGRDARVEAVMVEVNRKLYLNESDATPLSDFEAVARRVRQCCIEAVTLCCSSGARSHDNAR